MWTFERYPAKLEKQTEYGKYSVEVFGYIGTNIQCNSMFSTESPIQNRVQLMVFRETSISLISNITMLPIAEFEERFKDYMLC